MNRRRLAISGAVLALTVGSAGCGGGGDDQKDLPPLTSTPELVPPTSTPTTSSTIPTTTTPGSDTIKVRTIEEAPSDEGGGGGGGSDETLEPAPDVEEEQIPDNPKNDTPPKPDSSAERFEQFCASDPKACGN